MRPNRPRTVRGWFRRFLWESYATAPSGDGTALRRLHPLGALLMLVEFALGVLPYGAIEMWGEIKSSSVWWNVPPYEPEKEKP